VSLELLHEDEHLFAVFKPPWLLVHRGMGQDEDTLVDRVREWQGGGKVHPLHRLDRQTSGVVLFARHPDAARAAREVFDAGAVEKTYLAMVRGIAPDSGFIDYAIPKSEDGERIDAQTHFRRIASAELSPRAVSVVEARPVTGRFHQLRRHLRHIHHPILLDSNYGPTKLNRAFKREWGLPRLTLHALRVELDHPLFDNTRLVIESPLPDDLAQPWTEMGVWPVQQKSS
jgi:tRNA pseudouridine65 synthase